MINYEKNPIIRSFQLNSQKNPQKPRKIECGENHVSQRKIEVELVNIVIVEYHY